MAVRECSQSPRCRTPDCPPGLAGGFLYFATPQYFGDYALTFAQAGAEHSRRLLWDHPGSHFRYEGGARRVAREVSAQPRSWAVQAAGAGDSWHPASEPSTLKAKLGNSFVVSVEMDPPRGINPTKLLKAGPC